MIFGMKSVDVRTCSSITPNWFQEKMFKAVNAKDSID